jgi:peptidoglycan/LPS O-acetylase OafA/YrhL
LSRQGGVGVTFFFILSGFVLTWSASEVNGTPKFYLKRFARIYPLHFLTWAAMIPVTLYLASPQWHWSIALSCLFLAQAWIPTEPYYFGMNGPSWSLSCEAFFYAIFPYVMPVIRSQSRRSLLRLAVVITSAAALFSLCVELLWPKQSIALLYVLPCYRAWEFLIGIILAVALKAGWIRRIRASVAIAVVIITYALVAAVHLMLADHVGPFASLPFTGLPPAVASLMMAPAFASLILAAAMTDLRREQSFLSGTLLVKLGEWSFALYLSHLVVLSLLDPHVPDNLPLAVAVLAELGTLLLMVAVSGVLYQFVERPVEYRIRRFATRDRSRNAKRPEQVLLPGDLTPRRRSLDLDRSVGQTRGDSQSRRL